MKVTNKQIRVQGIIKFSKKNVDALETVKANLETIKRCDIINCNFCPFFIKDKNNAEVCLIDYITTLSKKSEGYAFDTANGEA